MDKRDYNILFLCEVKRWEWSLTYLELRKRRVDYCQMFFVSIRYILDIVYKGNSIVHYWLYLSSEQHVVEYKIAEMGIWRFYLAPKIEEDDEENKALINNWAARTKILNALVVVC